MNIIQSVPCTLVTGFLGSGKTTLINQLIIEKPSNSKWGLLINEFGQIGVDSALINDEDGLAIREVNGGCICCTSQLPLQISLSRLLSENNLNRIVIEPTGLAHPQILIEQLSEPHWNNILSMQKVICVLNAQQWLDVRYRENDAYQSHIQYADVILINRYQNLTDNDKQQLASWITEYNEYSTIFWMSDNDNMNLNDCTAEVMKHIQFNSQIMRQYKAKLNRQKRISLLPFGDVNHTDISESKENNDLPYRYHDSQQGMSVGGWRLPSHWIFDNHNLQNWLLTLPNWQRIKGVINTDDGWIRLNFTLDSLTTSQCPDQMDSRLEIILLESNDQLITEDDWQEWDHRLLNHTLIQ